MKITLMGGTQNKKQGVILLKLNRVHTTISLKTLSLGDKAISLHRLQLQLFIWEGRILLYSKLKLPSSDQIFILGWGHSWVLKTQSSKF